MQWGEAKEGSSIGGQDCGGGGGIAEAGRKFV